MTAFLVIWKIVAWVIRVVMLLIVPDRRPPAQARAWLFFILLFPVPGLVAYHVFGRAYQPRRLALLRERITLRLNRAIEQWTDRSKAEHPPLPDHLQGIPALVERLGGFSVLLGNSLEILDTHPESEDALVADIDAAEDHVHLLYFIFRADAAGQRIAAACKRAVQRGVRCRILIDAVGGKSGLRELAPSMREAGIEVIEMLPVGFFRKNTARFDLRNHRKIAVFDGRIGHIGSANIIEPVRRRSRKAEEIVARVRGPIVAQLQVVFLSDRYLELEEKIESAPLFPEPDTDGTVHAQVLPSGPVFDFSHTRKTVTTLVHNAKRRVTITTPFFVPDSSYINAFQSAALRGVEVNIIVPSDTDNPFTTLAQESFFEQLLLAGVRVHTFQPAFLHTKLITVDGEIGMVGSANMDIRSLDLNREVSMLIYDPGVVARLEAIERRYLGECREIGLDEWIRRPRLRRYLQNFARLFDSFL